IQRVERVDVFQLRQKPAHRRKRSALKWRAEHHESSDDALSQVARHLACPLCDLPALLGVQRRVIADADDGVKSVRVDGTARHAFVARKKSFELRITQRGWPALNDQREPTCVELYQRQVAVRFAASRCRYCRNRPRCTTARILNDSG